MVTRLGEDEVRRFIAKLAVPPENDFFKAMHEAVRSAVKDFAKRNGFTFTDVELEEVLWEFGLGHEQLELHSKSKDEAETRIKKRLDEEIKQRTQREKDRIRAKVRENAGAWRSQAGKTVDEHLAIMLTHSSTIG